MKSMKTKVILFILFLSVIDCTMIFSQDNGRADRREVIIRFINMVGSESLILDSSYTNLFGETFAVSKFRYYISNITFHDTVLKVKFQVADSYFLVDQANAESQTLTLPSPSTYNAISFLIGVDSAKSVNGAQNGALDPLNDMFWTWNTGYVMVKLEGTSRVSKLQRRLIEYHIGGFREPFNSLREVYLSLSNESLPRSDISIIADINYLFGGKHTLKIANNSACTIPGPLAVSYAENYQKMFYLKTP